MLQLSGMLVLTAITLSSYQYGIGGNGSTQIYTGGPSSLGTCGNSGCHGGSGTTTTATITLTEKSTNQLVTNGKYNPGVTYVVKITGSNSGTLSKYGFQVMPLNSGNTATPGTLTATQANTVVRTMASNKKLVEQTTMLTGASATNMTSSFEWTAPAAGAGTISFYGVVNAVNGNGNENGDKCSSGASAAFQENVATSVTSLNTENVGMSVFPNPATSMLTVVRKNHSASNATLQIVNVAGAVLYQTSLAGGQSTINVETAAFPGGVYFVTLIDAETRVTTSFLKRD